VLEHPGRTLIPGPDKEGKESMHEAIRNPVFTYSHNQAAAARELPGEVFTRRVITIVLALITVLTFAFGFGNVWALGRSLGVPAFVAPLVGPAVDLSVAGLLIGVRHLSMAGMSRDQLRPARVLLMACGAATLALNITGPVAAGAYGRAAFDSVGPGLLIGWAETGPGLLRCLYATRPGRPLPAPGHGQARVMPADEAVPGTAASVPARTGAHSGSANGDASRPRARQVGRGDAAGLEELLPRARQIDSEHRLRHNRPVSAETLRKQMRIGSMRARALVQQIRDAQDPPAQMTDSPSRDPQARGEVISLVGVMPTRIVSTRRQPRPVSLRRWRHDRAERPTAVCVRVRHGHQLPARAAATCSEGRRRTPRSVRRIFAQYRAIQRRPRG
jgi:hypothetical protein